MCGDGCKGCPECVKPGSTERPETETNATDEVIVVLTEEDGTEHEHTIVHVFAVNEKEYAVLLPVNDPEGDGETVLLRIDRDGDEDILVEIEDEEEFENVAEAWEEYLDDCERDGDNADEP